MGRHPKQREYEEVQTFASTNTLSSAGLAPDCRVLMASDPSIAIHQGLGNERHKEKDESQLHSTVHLVFTVRPVADPQGPPTQHCPESSSTLVPHLFAFNLPRRPVDDALSSMIIIDLLPLLLH
jgi:hypothetical protein